MEKINLHKKENTFLESIKLCYEETVNINVECWMMDDE